MGRPETNHTDSSDPMFELFTSGEDDNPECQISDCDRSGDVPRKVKNQSSEETESHYICQFHYRLLLGIKIAAVVVLAVLFLLVFFRV